MCEFFPHDFFCKNFVKLNILLKSYTVNQFDEKFSQWGKISEISTPCGVETVKIFEQNSVKSTSYMRRRTGKENISWNNVSVISQNRCFHEIFVKRVTVWKLQTFPLTIFSQKFRESNVFTKEISLTIFFSVKENFSVFHTVDFWKASFLLCVFAFMCLCYLVGLLLTYNEENPNKVLTSRRSLRQFHSLISHF